jgi:hypothetical protein
VNGLLGVRFLHRLRRRFQVRPAGGCARGGNRRQRHRRGGDGRRPAFDDRRRRAQRRGRDAIACLLRRNRRTGCRQSQHLSGKNAIDVLDVVPRGELAVVEAAVERNLMQRVAALDRIRRRRSRVDRRSDTRRRRGLRRARGHAIFDGRGTACRAAGHQQRDGDEREGKAISRGQQEVRRRRMHRSSD